MAAPPKLAEKLLLLFIKDELAEEVLGDLDEKFDLTIEERSLLIAKINFWYQVLNYLRPFALKSTKFKRIIYTPMKIHFIYNFRLFRRNSLISFASLISIVLGVLSSFLIYLWIDTETSTDQFHDNYDRLYLTVNQQSAIDLAKPLNTSLFFKTNYEQHPEVAKSIQLFYLNEDKVKFEHEKTIYKAVGMVADSTFFEVFDFKLLIGEPDLLKSPSKIILTESFAAKIFGRSDPLGKTIQLDEKNSYQVAGILEDIPSYSSFTFDFLVPVHSHKWWGVAGLEFLVMNKPFDLVEFNEKIGDIGKEHPQFKESITSIVPFSDVYFDSNLNDQMFTNKGNKANIQTMSIVALIIVFVSALNFTNMQSTLIMAQIKNRSIKRVQGARSFDFFLELLVSRLLFLVTSTALVVLGFYSIKPIYVDFLQLTVSHTWPEIFGLTFIACAIFILLTTVITLFQASIRPTTEALFSDKSHRQQIFGGSTLTTIQYVFAIILIISATVVFKQFKFMQNKDLGYDSSNVISAQLLDDVKWTGDEEAWDNDWNTQTKNYAYLKDQLTKVSGIESSGQGDLPVSKTFFSTAWKLDNSDYEYTDVKVMVIDPHYLEVMGLEMTEGRFFSDSLDASRQHKMVINQAAKAYWNIDTLDKARMISSAWGGAEEPYQIVGVVENFHFEHLSRKVEPLIMVYFEDADNEFIFRISENAYKQTIDEITEIYNEIYPGRALSFTELEEELTRQYRQEKKLAQTLLLFTFIALILSSLGLFTFALYDTQKRTKEIGIRKVMGASTDQVILLLSKTFIKWVILAFVIALPISWYASREWLANFANQTELSWWIFLGSGIIAVILATFTIMGQSYKVASQNPVLSLRNE